MPGKIHSGMTRKRLFTGIIVTAAVLAATPAFICTANRMVEESAEGRLYQSAKQIPKRKAGVVPGTSEYVAGGMRNLFFTGRVDAAVRLWNANKVDYIIVSGDNSTESYNEPRAMRRALIERGVPSERIVMDFAGFRTLDSVVRAKEVFLQNEIIFISQSFQNERAIFIGLDRGIDVIGFNAKDVTGPLARKTYYREYLARLLAVYDVVVNTQPKFYGWPVILPGDSSRSGAGISGRYRRVNTDCHKQDSGCNLK